VKVCAPVVPPLVVTVTLAAEVGCQSQSSVVLRGGRRASYPNVEEVNNMCIVTVTKVIAEDWSNLQAASRWRRRY